MKVKIIEHDTIRGLREEFNNFAKDRKIVDVKVTTIDAYDTDGDQHHHFQYHVFYESFTKCDKDGEKR